jgi:hypothetical protein
MLRYRAIPFQALLTLAMALALTPLFAAEGMWTLDNLPSDGIAKEFGFRPDAAWRESVMHSSVRLAGGCSGSFVSADGLVLTNHHCAAECVEALSTADKDYLRNGFVAKRRQDEISCPNVELNRLDQITDVSGEVKSALSGLTGEGAVRARRAVEAKLTSACAAGDPQHTRCDVVELYHGGLYNLYRYHRIQDVRLAFVPERAIAVFGGDPDNFNFPRYDLDMALLRAYEDGKPAAVKDFFRLNPTGAAAGELVFVTGHPGRTNRQLTLSQLETERDFDVTQSLIRLAELRGLFTEYGQISVEAARVSTTDLFAIENSYKALQGHLAALQDPKLWEQKQKEEARLHQWVRSHNEFSDADGAWAAIDAAQSTYRQIGAEYITLERATWPLGQHFNLARILVRGSDERAKPNGERFPEFSDAALPSQELTLFSTEPIYPDYERLKLTWALTKLRERLGADDPRVRQVLGKESPRQVAERVVAGTRLGDIAVRRALWTGGKAAVDASNDPAIVLARQIEPYARAVRKRYEEDVEAVVRKNTERLAAARFAMSGTAAYPDATFTLRISYGAVRGWEENGRTIAPFTTFAGAFARDTGADPFALPHSWWAAKDHLPADQAFNFVTTDDIIGGNSGSPVINRNREIVGLIFDGNLPSLGGDYWYDGRTNRAVAVHAGAIVKTLDVVYEAKDLVKELVGGK